MAIDDAQSNTNLNFQLSGEKKIRELQLEAKKKKPLKEIEHFHLR